MPNILNGAALIKLYAGLGIEPKPKPEISEKRKKREEAKFNGTYYKSQIPVKNSKVTNNIKSTFERYYD
jgi:hypothetical protein